MAQNTEIGESSPSKMLSKLKDHAALAISVTTGKKLAVKKSKHSNVIPGFGYAMMDLFENQFVDMESIVNTQLEVVEETRSPFSSPKKKERSPLRDGSITKEEYRRKRKEERQDIIDAKEQKEQKAPNEFKLIRVKTAVGNYPTINYISPFSNDEIM
jgi:flagellar motor protein MotB